MLDIKEKIFNAFTLAEVLIVLGIIGVVAEMTIPTLMNNVSDMQFKSGWKKAFSVFSQATQKMAYDNGGSLEGYFTSDSDIRDKYLPYMIKSKSCNDSQGEGCWPTNTKGLNGQTNVVSTGPAIILNDGSLVQFWLGDTNCTQAIGSPATYYRCAGAIVDVNGLKKPNVIGKDTFEFHILKDRILPYGMPNESYSNDCNSSGMGQSCSAVYLYK